MGYPQTSAGRIPRQPLHLSLPVESLLGLVPTSARVRPDFDLEAVEIAFEVEAVLLSPPATIDLIMRLIDAISELRLAGRAS